MSVLIKNRKATYDYAISSRLEAGLVLQGWEVKSIKNSNVSLKEAFIHVEGNDAWVYQMRVSPWKGMEHVDDDMLTKPRKLLLHRKEIDRLSLEQKKRGITIIPLSLYENRGKVKMEIGIGKGKRKYEKREKVSRKDFERSLQMEPKSTW